MSTPPVPSYPVIHVNVAADGSGHLNVAGQHHDYPVGSPEYTRRAVTAFATELAGELHRPVRMQITDSQGHWLVAVHPNGTVTDLSPSTKQPPIALNRSAATPPARPPSPGATEEPSMHPAPAPPAYRIPTRTVSPMGAQTPSPRSVETETSTTAHSTPFDDSVQHTRLSERKVAAQSPMPVATLTFSTGLIAHIPPGGALLGRRPNAEQSEQAELTIAIDDQPKSVSRTHLWLQWQDTGLWMTDQASSNGTRIQRAQQPPRDLTPWLPFKLQDGDIVELGDLRAVVAIPAGNPEVSQK